VAHPVIASAGPRGSKAALGPDIALSGAAGDAFLRF
jgi:hypothetical protein